MQSPFCETLRLLSGITCMQCSLYRDLTLRCLAALRNHGRFASSVSLLAVGWPCVIGSEAGTALEADTHDPFFPRCLFLRPLDLSSPVDSEERWRWAESLCTVLCVSRLTTLACLTASSLLPYSATTRLALGSSTRRAGTSGPWRDQPRCVLTA